MTGIIFALFLLTILCCQVEGQFGCRNPTRSTEILVFGKEKTLNCTIPSGVSGDEWKWTRTFEGKTVPLPGDDEHIKIDAGNSGLRPTSSVMIKAATLEQAGTYEARAKIGGGAECTVCTIEAEMAPCYRKPGRAGFSIIEGLQFQEPSYILLEGGTERMICHLEGNPKAKLEWRYGRGNDSRIVQNSASVLVSQDKRVLTFNNAASNQSSEYTCWATNQHGTASVTIRLRVKSQLGPLWPVIGIIAQLVILALVIFFCERRRKAREEEEEDDDGAQLSQMNSTTPPHTGKGKKGN